MIRQKSFENNQPSLYLVATPIGNLTEMSPRAIDILKTVDIIAAEDTRTTMKLLSHFDIHTRCIAHHMHNEKKSAVGLLNLLQEGKNIALVSDAGYPLLSDPGQSAVELITEAGYNVIPVSGSNAMLNGLVASGLVVMPFYFKGFLSSNSTAAKKECEQLANMDCTLVFYEAPHRITKTLQIFLEVFGNRKICLARELTKKHEEFIRGTISEVLEIADELKGEMVLILEGKQEEQSQLTESEILNQVNLLIEQGISSSYAVKQVAKEFNLSKNEVYKLVNQQNKQ